VPETLIKEADPLLSSGAHSRAILNILADLTDDQAWMHDTHKAVVNVLSDFSEEKDRLQLTQRAVLNILQDVEDERAQRERAEAEVRQINANLEERVTQRTLQLESANKELEGFSYSVAHDLRTPLRAIQGFSRILKEDHAESLDDEALPLLGIIVDATNKMSQLIDDMLAFSRIGRLGITLRQINMRELVDGVVAELTREATATTLELGSLANAFGDTGTIRQVWVNLLGNAVKYSSKNDNPVVQIDSNIEQNEIIYRIKDNGVGFDMQYAHKLFGVFQRLHGADEFSGTGIGLAIVKRIVERHRGRVWAESVVGKGSTFYFTLPSGTSQ
jgi:light-regulated signal transduction histidine kinase (bacteriophytochrome)